MSTALNSQQTSICYIVEKYVETDNTFLSKLWAKIPKNCMRITNGAELYHGYLKGKFYNLHCTFHTVIETLQ